MKAARFAGAAAAALAVGYGLYTLTSPSPSSVGAKAEPSKHPNRKQVQRSSCNSRAPRQGDDDNDDVADFKSLVVDERPVIIYISYLFIYFSPSPPILHFLQEDLPTLISMQTGFLDWS